MRSSLSCAFCRKSKIKCVNSGSSPCQKCQKSQIPGCILSRPRHVATRVSRRRGRSNTDHKDHEEPSGPRPVSPSHEESRAELFSDCLGGDSDISRTDEHLASLPTGVILKSLNVFTNKFPELGILHLPTLMQAFELGCSKETKVLLSAILLVTKSQLSFLNPSWASSLLSGKDYEFYARQALSEFILQPPNIQVVQALLIMTLYEWGGRNFHKAWVYCGTSLIEIDVHHG
ncbi:uncharacterized protein BDW43DRAFT_294487 [Aspergillus alliaceus]|uniref:uncharacterized protein n=1 Tax=Petromyces alliaceus TaxID=209559 RepID=UPI0012A56E45|nr:uncharacterized protein BDW43DRAFT_294487 [Aspergillus alliaceus]KAB8227321.1 hypothetical protein BDW43DRAFT_294487 [Aspergillus alliaceus]